MREAATPWRLFVFGKTGFQQDRFSKISFRARQAVMPGPGCLE